MESELLQFEVACNDLEGAVEQIRLAGFKTQNGSQLLMEKKRAILSHFVRLNRDFIPALKQASDTWPTVSQTVRFFVADSQNTIKAINDFFIQYPYHENSLAFASEYGKIFALLINSVHKHNAVCGLIQHAQKQNQKHDRVIGE